eukprot:m.155082 g.155082  ORF g.155082 m.155082 type:complete len:65 (-) comp16405_c0_seq4:60-254(-)
MLLLAIITSLPERITRPWLSTMMELSLCGGMSLNATLEQTTIRRSWTVNITAFLSSDSRPNTKG